MTSLKMLILLISLFITFSEAITFREVIEEEWAAFKQLYKKEYLQHEDNFRIEVFMKNKFMIAQHNRKYDSGVKSYKLNLNHYGDWSQNEFEIFNGYNRTASSKNGILFMTPEHLTVPSSIDWRERNLVTPVKDQGHCGSCWSFSATGALEGQHSRKTGKLISLSEQNLIDCSKDNNGCNGGLMDNAFEYIKQNHGIDTEESYPYEGKEGVCRYQKNNSGATDTGFVDIPEGDEAKLKEAIATVGPVSIAIDASHPSFRFYSEGVYDEAECSSTELDHGVLVVGYGTDEKGMDYWIVKNSWSTKWGEGGYVRMVRNKNNQCGVATSASYPLV